MAIKVKELAQMLDVSPSTISLVLNNKPGISEETRERVREKLKELGQEDLMKNEDDKKKNLLFIVYRRNEVNEKNSLYFSQIFSEIIEGVESQVKNYNYNLLITYVNRKNMKTKLNELIDEKVQGAIVLATEIDNEQLKCIENIKIPIVLLDSYIEQGCHDCITINNEQGMYKGIECLVKNGHKDIGYLHFYNGSRNFQERYFGYLRAMEMFNIKVNKKNILKMNANPEKNSYERVKKALLSINKMPTAFFCDNDIVASNTIRILREMGYKVPEEISVIGFDDMPLSEMLDPPLTTIHIPKRKMGIVAVKQMADRIENKNNNGFVKIEISTNIIERKSINFIQ